VPDPRQPELVDYPLRSLLRRPIVLLLCRLGVRRQIHFVLNTPRVVRYLSRLAHEKLHRLPHGDTVADALAELHAFLNTPIQVRLDTS
jgi:hypothetical protein